MYWVSKESDTSFQETARRVFSLTKASQSIANL
jgi:hypothetical protein